MSKFPLKKNKMPMRYLLIVASICGAVLLPANGAKSAAPSGVNQNNPLSQWYKTLRVPGTTVGCCDDSDCRVVQSRFDGTFWWAFIEPGNHPGAPAGGAWIVVPQDRILKDKTHPAGSAVACWLSMGGDMVMTEPLPLELGLLCFIPPGIGG